MSSITASSRGQIGMRQLLLVGAVVVPVALFVAWVAHTAAGYRALLEQERLNEMAAESHALCEKWGMPASSLKHSECIADIQSVRDKHEQRVAEDFEPL